jgi:carboxyl-terminal processing protease
MQPILKKYTAEDFFKNYIITDADFGNFIQYASKTIKRMDPRELLASKENIKTVLKASAARFKWGDEAYFKTINANDVAVKKAVEAL